MIRFSPEAIAKLKSPEPAQLRDSLTDITSGTFAVADDVRAIPPEVQSAFAAVRHQPRFWMSNPGEPFESTDVISGKLPRTRLILTGMNARTAFILFEQGGYALHNELYIFSLKPAVALAWKGSTTQEFHNLEQLQAGIKSDQPMLMPVITE